MKKSIILSSKISLSTGLIFSLLCALIAPRIFDRIEVARCTKINNDFKILKSLLEIHKKDNGSYPTTQNGLLILSQSTKNNSQLISRIPNDPWDNKYYYQAPALINKAINYDLYSYGENQFNDQGLVDDFVSWKEVSCPLPSFFSEWMMCLMISFIFITLPLFIIFILIHLGYSRFTKT